MPGLNSWHLKGAGAVRLEEVVARRAVLDDLEVKGAQHRGQIRARRVHDRLYRVRVDLLPLRDHADERLALGDGVRPEVAVHGVDDVIRVERLAVVELDAFAELEGPLGHVGVRLPLLRDFRRQGEVVVEAHEAVVVGADPDVVGGPDDQDGIQGVVRPVHVPGEAETSAALGGIRPRIPRGGNDGPGARDSHSQGEQPLHELAAADAALLECAPHAPDLGCSVTFARVVHLSSSCGLGGAPPRPRWKG